MSESYISLPTSGNMPALARAQAHTIGGNTVLSQAVVLIDPATGNVLNTGTGIPVSKGIAAFQSLLNATVVGNGNVINLVYARSNIGMQVVFSGPTSNLVVVLEGSLNGTDFYTLSTWTNAFRSGDIMFTDSTPVQFLRASVVALNGSPIVNTWIIAS